MQIDIKDFLAWVKEQGPDTTFEWTHPFSCATAMYLKAKLEGSDESFRVHTDGYHIGSMPHSFPPVLHRVHTKIAADSRAKNANNAPLQSPSFRMTYADLVKRIEDEMYVAVAS